LQFSLFIKSYKSTELTFVLFYLCILENSIAYLYQKFQSLFPLRSKATTSFIFYLETAIREKREKQEEKSEKNKKKRQSSDENCRFFLAESKVFFGVLPYAFASLRSLTADFQTVHRTVFIGFADRPCSNPLLIYSTKKHGV